MECKATEITGRIPASKICDRMDICIVGFKLILFIINTSGVLVTLFLHLLDNKVQFREKSIKNLTPTIKRHHSLNKRKEILD